ncbi:LacI family DNA-binding transcriptional regulator [Streptomyces sp. L7]
MGDGAAIDSGAEPRKITINDVAKSAGVSRQTVSRALNDKDEIDVDTKQRVLDAARGARVPPEQVRPRSGPPGHDDDRAGHPRPAQPVLHRGRRRRHLEAARTRGWQVVVYDTGDRAEEELGTLQVISSQVDAVIGSLQPVPRASWRNSRVGCRWC